LGRSDVEQRTTKIGGKSQPAWIRDKAGKFLRPDMTAIDSLGVLFWDDLPAPKEDEPPKIEPQKTLAGFGEEESEKEEEGGEEPEEDEDREETD
jgi:hypothetical protein